MIISGEMLIGVSGATLIAIIIVAFKFGSYVKALKNDIKNNTENIIDLKETVKEHSNKIQDIEISDAENKVRILNIDTRVVEILSILKDK
jgi:uncharacterized phage-associated protein